MPINYAAQAERTKVLGELADWVFKRIMEDMRPDAIGAYREVLVKIYEMEKSNEEVVQGN
jgi:hypothetical protein